MKNFNTKKITLLSSIIRTKQDIIKEQKGTIEAQRRNIKLLQDIIKIQEITIKNITDIEVEVERFNTKRKNFLNI